MSEKIFLPPAPKLDLRLDLLPPPQYHLTGSAFGFQHQIAPLTENGLENFRARLGKLACPHGSIELPNFIFCGTKASVKAISTDALRAAQSDIILTNTYHLLLNPGVELIAGQGGIHRFMRWHGPLLSDSGGYQVFAMGHGSVSEEIKGKRKQIKKQKLLKISEEGVTFYSYVNGSKVFLSPESSVDVQRKLGVDFMVQFDECTPYHVSREYTEASMQMSVRWGARSLAEFIAHDTGSQAIYGVIQGGVYPELRRISAARVSAMPFFGTAIGGCLGKTRQQMWQVTADTVPLLPLERPIHLLGIGHIADIFWGILQGIDTFDCVHPTRLARHGCAILPYACGYNVPGLQAVQVNLKQSRFKQDSSPLFASQNQLFQSSPSKPPAELDYSKSYIQHLLRSNELLGPQILTINNVFQMNALMRDIRLALRENRFGEVLYYWLGLSLSEFLLHQY